MKTRNVFLDPLWDTLLDHFDDFWEPPGSRKCILPRRHALSEMCYFRPKCCFTSAPCTSVSVETLLLTCFFELLGAPPGAPERRMGGKCAYYRGATLIFHENVCFAEAKRTYWEPQGHVGTMLGHLASIIGSPGGSMGGSMGHEGSMGAAWGQHGA